MPRPLRFAIQILAMAVVGALFVILVWRVADNSQTVAEALADGEAPSAPDFTLERLDGRGQVSLASMRGRPLVLDFWASWCRPCIAESKRLESARRRYGDRVTFLGVNTEDLSHDARRWLRRHGITYPSVRDGNGDVLDRWGGLPIPRIFFVDRRGKVVGEMITQEDLPRYLRRIA